MQSWIGAARAGASIAFGDWPRPMSMSSHAVAASRAPLDRVGLAEAFQLDRAAASPQAT
jgi:hypothetical protein